MFYLICGIPMLVLAQTMPEMPTVGVDQSYGTECGFTKIVPAYRDSLERFVKKQDHASVRRWLHSENPTKTAYAIEGMHRSLRAIELSEEDRAVIHRYQTENIELVCCGSGVPQPCSSKKVLKRFEFPE